MLQRVYFSWILSNYNGTLLPRSALILLLGSEGISFSNLFLTPAVWSIIVLCISVTKWVLSFFGTYKSYKKSYKKHFKEWLEVLAVYYPSLLDSPPAPVYFVLILLVTYMSFAWCVLVAGLANFWIPLSSFWTCLFPE